MADDQQPKPKWGDRDWYGEQDANGVDISLIRANLRLSVDERLAKGDQGRLSAQQLMRYPRQDGDQFSRADRDGSPETRG